MKPSRKLNRSSFMSRVSGGAPSDGGQKIGGAGKAVESDYDLAAPGSKGGGPGADPDGGPR